MADTFNPYAEWLGLPAEQTEPNYYQLLGLANFEEDTTKIATGADRAMNRVRGFRPGSNARAWSKLLDELLLAKGKLLDPERKQEYDAELLESGTTSEKKDEPAKSPASPQSSTPVSFDPRFPPGMGPNSGKSAPKEVPPPEPVRNPAPAPVAPAPIAQPIAAPAAMSLATPVATFASVPAAAWPNSMLHPVAHAPVAAAPVQAAPQQAVPQPALPQPAPLAQPMYGAPQTQSGYAAPGYPQYPGVPQYGMPQPSYGQQPYPPPAYGAPPAPQYGASMYQQPAPGYGQPYAMPPQSPPPAEPPVSGSYGGYGAFPGSKGSSLGGTMFGPSAHAPQSHAEPLSGMPLDPMAPVAMPTALPGDEPKNRVVGFAAGSAIPKGKAVSPAPAASAPSSPGPVITTSAPIVPATLLAASVPDATVAAAQIESSKHDKMLFWGATAGVLLLISAIVFAIVQGNQVNREVAENPIIPPEPAPRVEPKPAGPTKQIMPAIKPSETKPPVERPVDPTPPPPMPKPPEPKEPTPPPEAKPQPPEMKPESKPMETIPVPTPPKPPEPKPPEPTPPTEVKLTPAELMALSTHLKSAKEALRERNFAETETNIAAALKLAKSPEQLAQTNRLKLVADYVKQFDRSLKTLMADENFDAGAELVIGKGTRVVVVERDPTMIVIRIAGMNKSYALASLPDGLAMALIDKRLDPNDPVTKIIKASYLAAAKVSTEENQEKAKSLWEEARAVDSEAVADLPMFLTDSYDFTE